MPKVVDHEHRRRELAQAAVRLIAREGLGAASTRALASESGWTTGVLKHYFAGKDDILRHALLELEAVSRERLEAAEQEEASGRDALRTAVGSMLEEEPAHTRVWVAFLGRAAADPEIAALMQTGTRAWQRRWADLVRRGQADGSIASGADPEDVAAELWALVCGLRIGALFDPKRARHHGTDPILLLQGLAARGSADANPVIN